MFCSNIRVNNVDENGFYVSQQAQTSYMQNKEGLKSMICPECGATNRVGVQTCTNCGADLYQSLLDMVSTKKLSTVDTRELSDGDAVSPTSNPIVIYVTTDDSNPIAVERRAEVVLGRIDPNNPEEGVDVDLELYAAQEYGVSRKHAILHASSNPPSLVDLGSYNGTFINGEKLVPQQAYQLHSSDEIRLGRLILRVYYK